MKHIPNHKNFGLILPIIVFALIGAGCTPNPAGSMNHPPEIIRFSATPSVIRPLGSEDLDWTDVTTLICVAKDAEQDELTYVWKASWGEFLQNMNSPSVQWGSRSPGYGRITVYVIDGLEFDSASVEVLVRG